MWPIALLSAGAAFAAQIACWWVRSPAVMAGGSVATLGLLVCLPHLWRRHREDVDRAAGSEEQAEQIRRAAESQLGGEREPAAAAAARRRHRPHQPQGPAPSGAVFDDRLRGGRLGVDDALDEVLWRAPPMTHMPARYALRDIDLGGQPVRHGDVLILGLSAANSDHTLAPPGKKQPDNRAHMAYSAGPHMCPAQDTARVITRTAVDTALHLLPGLRLAISPDEVTWNPSPWTRCPTRLPVSIAVVPHFSSPASARLRPVGDHA